MAKQPGEVVLKNGRQSATFRKVKGGYRPEWFRLADRPMLRFKDHEWLNVGQGARVTAGKLLEQTKDACTFGGVEWFGGTRVEWYVRVARPADGGGGFVVTTRMVPPDESMEVLEALTAYETPYEYDGDEESMFVMCQQPVYRFRGGEELSGAGYMHPHWYYGRGGRAHLTYPCASPLLCHRVRAADGGNERCIMLLGNWDVCSAKDMFAQPTRALGRKKDDVPFDDPKLAAKAGLHGTKYLMGAVNWNTSLHKDPNVLVEREEGLAQEVTVDFAAALPEQRWDAWLAAGWERLVRIHLPRHGVVPAHEVARSRGASWTAAAEWLASALQQEEGYPGFFDPEAGTCVYAPGTRPRWDPGVAIFCGQWTGPLAYLGRVWADAPTIEATTRLERIFASDTGHKAENIWTIGPTPQYVAVLRKAALMGIEDATLAKVRDYVTRRTDYLLDPPAGAKTGDGGIFAWDAFANLLASDHFDRKGREAAAKACLEVVLDRLEHAFWTFNCAAEGDLVGAGQSRPFGHAIALSACMEAYLRFGEERYRDAALQFANLFLGMHCITWNESPSEDLDTRGWCHGSTGGRDQWAQLPPWETGHAHLQLAYLMREGLAREGIYDVLWLFARTGLAQFPAARTMKRLYTPRMEIVYRQIDSLPTEREFYLSRPYLAYENPWDQTMAAGYQGVEGILLSLFLGGGILASTDDRVSVFVPEAALYAPDLARGFTAQLWNPLPHPVATRIAAPVLGRRGGKARLSGAVKATLTPEAAFTERMEVPPRTVVEVECKLD